MCVREREGGRKREESIGGRDRCECVCEREREQERMDKFSFSFFSDSVTLIIAI